MRGEDKLQGGGVGGGGMIDGSAVQERVCARAVGGGRLGTGRP